jgi:hypothetical protein
VQLTKFEETNLYSFWGEFLARRKEHAVATALLQLGELKMKLGKRVPFVTAKLDNV